jgi:hypothetical protein
LFDMLETIEVLEGSRRTLRRGVHMLCNVTSDVWDEAVPFVAQNLSTHGMWLDSTLPLEVGQRLQVAFKPPRWRSSRELLVKGRVRRVDLRRGRSGELGAGMGIEFTGLHPWEQDALRMALEGLPPPLPTRALVPRTELLWVESLLTWTEDLGDRVNVYEVSDLLALDQKSPLRFEALGELLTNRAHDPFAFAAALAKEEEALQRAFALGCAA